MKISKRIMFTEPYVAKLVDKELSEPEAGQVQVRIMVSTISSGTERAKLVGDVNVDSTSAAKAQAEFPRAGGYSSAGKVVAVGENVIAVTVKQGNAVKVYTVTVTRAAS